MFAKNLENDNSSPKPPTPREIELTRLRRWLFVGSLAYTTVLLASMLGSACLMLIQFIPWVKGLPKGVEPTFGRLMQDAPQVFYTAVAGGIFGLALAAIGFMLLFKALGRDKWPPKKVVVTLGTLPMVLGVVGLGATMASAGLGAVLMFPLVLGYTLAFVPMELGLLSAGLLSLALQQIGQRAIPIAPADLPPAAADYLNQVDADALEAGLIPLGDYSYTRWNKYRRFWMAPNGAYFVDATWCSLGQTTIQAVCVCGGTSDGHYFETADQAPHAGSGDADSEQSLAHMTHMPGASLARLIDNHIHEVGEWVERTGSLPLELASEDVHTFTDYGVAAYMREMKSDLLWLGNPFVGQPLPPMPGRPWQPEEAPVPLP